LAHQLNVRQRFNGPRDGTRKRPAIDGKGSARRHSVRFGYVNNQRFELAHFRLEQSRGSRQGIGTEGITADDLGKIRGRVGFGPAPRPHFEKLHSHTSPGQLPSCLGAGQPAADDANNWFHELGRELAIVNRVRDRLTSTSDEHE
jgi:hypothetical protein